LYLKADWRTGKALKGFKRAAMRRRRLAIVPREDGEEQHAEHSAPPKTGREDSALYDKVDAVLDKISAEGMSSLTRAELKLLDDVSKKHRTN
jgi:hypothetical protein